MAKDTCPLCKQPKDTRAKHCRPCRFKVDHPRLSTGNGWVKNKLGYVTSCINGRYVFQHRYVMEEHLGRKLSTKEHVHHIDGNRSNNDISNLEIMGVREHHRHHLTSDVAKQLSIKGHRARWGK